MLKILIADHSEEFRVALAGILRSRYVVECCSNGIEALSMLGNSHPDILIIDLMLPEADGLSVIKQATGSGICPTILVTSRYFSDYVLDALQKYQVAWAVQKPCRLESLIERVDDLAAQAAPAILQPVPRTVITTALLAMNFPTNQKGFTYIREAILILSQDPGQQLTKEIYPAIGKAHHSNGKAVERAIRHSVFTAWSNPNHDAWRQYFPCDSNGNIPHPTNSEFLSRMADLVLQFPRQKAI